MILMCNIGTNLYVVWVNYLTTVHYVPVAALFVAYFFVSLCLLVLFPYFSYLFGFLDPGKVSTATSCHITTTSLTPALLLPRQGGQPHDLPVARHDAPPARHAPLRGRGQAAAAQHAAAAGQ